MPLWSAEAECENPAGLTLADLKFKPEAMLELVNLVEGKTISSSAAQQVFAEMFATRQIARRHRPGKRPGAGQRHRRD